MSKSKTARRRKQAANQASGQGKPAADRHGSRGLAFAVVGATLVAALGLFLYRNSLSNSAVQRIDSAIAPLTPTEHPIPQYAGPAAFTYTLENAALSPTGRVTAWSFEGNQVVMCIGLWNADGPDLSQQISLDGHTAPVLALAFSSSGEMLASASADHTAKLWDVASGQEVISLPEHAGKVTAVCFAPDGVSVVTGSDDHLIRVWDAYGGLPMATLDGHTGAVTSLAFNAPGNVLASASDDRSIKLWDMEIGQQTGAIDIGDQPPVLAMVFSPTQPVLATSDGGGVVRLWNSRTCEEIKRVELDGTQVLSVAFSPDGRAIAASGVDGRMVVSRLDNDEVLADFVAPDTPLLIQYATDGALRWSRLDRRHLTQIGATSLAARVATAKGTADSAIAGFGVPDGAKVELFADESFVANPAAICTDEQGRIFVAETFRFDTEVSLGYGGREIWLLDDLANQTTADRLAMYEKYKDQTAGGMNAHRKHSERIRRLEDSDGDGRVDRATTFADGFNSPLTGTGTGLIARDGDLYYTCIPDLWKLTDKDDDGIADSRRSLHTGFGVNASLPHGLHGLAWGPDGKLYFSIGDRGYHIESSDAGTMHSPATGAVLRCNPDGSELEQVARGFRNPQELAFDRFGNLFTCDNNSNQGDRSRLIYVVPGADYGWHMSYETMPPDYPLGPWNMDKLWETPGAGHAAWVLPPIAHIGTGPAGLAYFPILSPAASGGGLPDRYEDHFFLCDFVDAPEASGVRSFSVGPVGAGFQVDDVHTFISNFLPTDIEFGLDQKIYISDWIHGATSDGLGRIYTVSYPAHIDADKVKSTQELFARGFDTLRSDELIELLNHADMRVRGRAQFTLADRGRDATDALAAVAQQSGDVPPRLHAIWALGMMGRQDASVLNSLTSLLEDGDPEVRGQAAKVLGECRHQASAEELVKLLSDESPRVRAFASYSIGRIGHRAAISPLLEMLRENQDQDVFLRHAGVEALFRIGDADAVAGHAADADRSVRLAVLLTLRRFGDERMAQFLNDLDEALVVEASRAIHDLPIEAAMDALADTISRPSDNESLLRRAINANFRLGQPGRALALTQFASSTAAPEAMRIEAIRALGDWDSPPQRDRVLGVVRAMPRGADDSVATVIAPWIAGEMESPRAALQKELILAAAHLNIDVGDVSWITDKRRDVEVRMQVLDMMAVRDDARLQQAIDAALESGEPLLRVDAATRLASSDQPRAIDALSKILEDGTIAEKQFALTTLGTIQSPQADLLLTDWLGRLQSGQVPPPLKYEIMSAANERDSAMVRQSLSSLIGFLSQQPTIAGRYQAVLEGGSIERGKALLENHTALQCIRCHAVDGQGGKIGPDLSKIGSKVTREYLLESLLVPEAKIAEGYEGVLISTTDGRVLSGTLQSEDEREIRIVDANGKASVVAKDEIAQRRGGKSVMPGDLLRKITSSDLRDLIAYLASLK
jgi:quinoprotein glucose dehydrogenase